MPPSGFSQKAINGLLMFVGTCYEDLLREIKEGKKTEEQAIQQELMNIRRYLKEFKIEEIEIM
jgi:dihydrodipicolinate synthase/N-acetylneuraminate lyase